MDDSEILTRRFNLGVLQKSLSAGNNKDVHLNNNPSSPTDSRPPQSPSPQQLDGNSRNALPLPGPPRDLVAQIVRPRFVTLSWMEPSRHPDEAISYDVFYKMTTSDRERKIHVNTQDISISTLLPGKTYQFRVVANSHHGPGDSSEVLQVSTQPEENIPGPPRAVQGYAVSHRQIHVKWEPPLIANGIIGKYRVYYVEGEDGLEKSADSISLESHLSDLRPHTEYTISVVPINQNGMGDPSQEIKVKTYSSTPSDPPSNVTVEATSSTSIMIRWSPLPLEKRNGQITGYKIRFKKQKKLIVETTPGTAKQFELRNLERNSAYQVKIAAMSVNGTGPFTEWLHVETFEKDLDETQVPRAPSKIAARPQAESIDVYWEAPVPQDIKVRGFILGWGKGIPDEETREFEDHVRQFKITGLETNSEYVLSLRARNEMGDGPPIYDYVKTRDEQFTAETSTPLEVPVRLRAITMSSNSIVVYWTDTTLSKSQHVTDSRHYLVRYNPSGGSRFKYHNTTELNCMIGDLKPNTMYEFVVKVVKGRRESPWSMSEFNSTFSGEVQVPAPRDLVANSDDNNQQNVLLKWTMPVQYLDQITGYLVLFTTDMTKRDRDWSMEPIVGNDVNVAVIRNLQPQKTYYFKVQTRNVKGYGPFSALLSYTTGTDIMVATQHNINGMDLGNRGSDSSGSHNNHNNQNSLMLYIIIGISVFTLLVASLVAVLLCRRKAPETPEHNKKSYQKNNSGIVKPPDLWIHHDQMELKESKAQTQTPGSECGASSCGGMGNTTPGVAMTLPRPALHDFEAEHPMSQMTNSLDKRTYVPGYMTTTMTTSMERNSQFGRPQFTLPRTQMGMDVNGMSQQSLLQPQLSKPPSLVQTPSENLYSYDTMTSNYSNNSSVTYAPGLCIEAPKRTQLAAMGTLKSFSGVPSCGPGMTNGILLPGQTIKSHPIPTVTIRPQMLNGSNGTTPNGTMNLSPFKKQSLSLQQPSMNRLQNGALVAHSAEEMQRLQPSTSTEELNQEMANLEGLMKDLSAITANEFEC